MELLYVDESGKSGLNDPVQPFHIMGGVIVSEQKWLAVEADLLARVDVLFPPPRPDGWEIHAFDIREARGLFTGVAKQPRGALIGAVLDVMDAHELVVEMVVIDKKAHKAKYHKPYPPEELAYQFMIERFQYYLGRRSEDLRGMIVSDDQKGQEQAVRTAHGRYRRQGSDYSAISQIVETPFFAPSHASCMLQIVDVAAYYCNRWLRARSAGKNDPPAWTRVAARLDTVTPWTERYPAGLKFFPAIPAFL